MGHLGRQHPSYLLRAQGLLLFPLLLSVLNAGFAGVAEVAAEGGRVLAIFQDFFQRLPSKIERSPYSQIIAPVDILSQIVVFSKRVHHVEKLSCEEKLFAWRSSDKNAVLRSVGRLLIFEEIDREQWLTPFRTNIGN